MPPTSTIWFPEPLRISEAGLSRKFGFVGIGKEKVASDIDHARGTGGVSRCRSKTKVLADGEGRPRALGQGGIGPNPHAVEHLHLRVGVGQTDLRKAIRREPADGKRSARIDGHMNLPADDLLQTGEVQRRRRWARHSKLQPVVEGAGSRDRLDAREIDRRSTGGGDVLLVVGAGYPAVAGIERLDRRQVQQRACCRRP